ncbi:MAG: hypothetical protein JW950_09680 [Deltaproteobacteria bacterium]|nr:hypothetical protein [Deltaproteobacteria bacterium]
MKKRFALLLLIGFGMLVLSGCSNSDSTPVPASTTLATSADASVTLTGSTAALPAGVTAADITLTPVTVGLPVAPAEANFLAAVECGPTGTAFLLPVTLTFKLTPARTPGATLTIYFLSGGAWIAAGTGATVSADGLTASASITHFSTYGLFEPNDIALPGDKFFTFLDGVILGGVPSEIMYDDVTGALILPHASAIQVAQAYNEITQAAYGDYQDSNGTTPPVFPATAGTVYIMRSTMPWGSAATYYKLQIISRTLRDGPTYGVVTFRYEKILPLDIVDATGEWVFPGGEHLSVLDSTIAIDYTPVDHGMYAIDGDYTSRTTLSGNFTTWDPTTLTGAVTVTLSLTPGGNLNVTLVGDAPLGTVTLNDGVKQ